MTQELSAQDWQYVSLKVEDGIAWVAFNRPEKRNAMNPGLNREMMEILDLVELSSECKVLVLTGNGPAFSAGMDLKQYFKEMDDLPPVARYRIYREAADWQWRRLRLFSKPTIAMVNGWCLGGGFVPLIACDLAIASEEAQFGLSEINWGIIPAGNVSKALSTVISNRAALFFIMTGSLFDGRKAAEMGLVNEAVPAADLVQSTIKLAKILIDKNPIILRQAKISFKNMEEMSWELADDYLRAKQEEGRLLDPEHGREKGMEQFLEKKTFKPGLGAYSKE